MNGLSHQSNFILLLFLRNRFGFFYQFSSFEVPLLNFQNSSFVRNLIQAIVLE